MPEPLTITLGGRTFQAARETTARHDGWVMVEVATAGLDATLATLTKRAREPMSEEEMEAAARAVVVQALRSGRMYHLLAGTLVEVGVPWSVKTAEANAEFFASLTDPTDKATLREVFVGVLAGFLSSVGRSEMISPKSSASDGLGQKRTRRRTPKATGGARTSASGGSLSGS